MQFNGNDALQFLQASQQQPGLVIQGSQLASFPNGYIHGQDRGFQQTNYGAHQQIVMSGQLQPDYVRPAMVQNNSLQHLQNYSQGQLINCNNANIRTQGVGNQQVFIRTDNGIRVPNGTWVQDTEPFAKYVVNASDQLTAQLAGGNQQMQPIQVHIPPQRPTNSNLQQQPTQFSSPIQGIPLYKSHVDTNASTQNVQIVDVSVNNVAAQLRPQMYQQHQLIDPQKLQQTMVQAAAMAAQQSPKQASMHPSLYQTSLVGAMQQVPPGSSVQASCSAAVYTVPQAKAAAASIYVVPAVQPHQPGD